MPSIRSIAALAATLAVGAQALPRAALEERQTSLDRFAGPYLNILARQAGKMWFGTAADIPGPEQQDAQYMALLNDTNFFGEITPANYMKWEFTEPQRGVFDLSGGNVVVNLAKARGKAVRCHNLVWQTELPTWLTSGKWDNATLISIMRTHIFGVVQGFGGACYSWDVVNEAFNGDGSYASNIFYNTIGPAYVPLAFQFATQAADAAGLKVKLYYNDYGIENPGAKANAVINLASQVRAIGGRIDGAGLESHFIVGSSPSRAQLVSVMNSYAAAGMESAITELDVRFTNVSNIAAVGGYAQQATDYYNSVAACLDVSTCVGVVVWDFVDKYSWIPSTFAGQGLATPFNSDYTRKPAFTAIGQALAKTTCTVCR